MRNEWYAGAELGLGLGNLPSGPRTEAGYQGLDGGLHLSGAFGMRLNPRWLIGLRYTNALAHHMYDGPEGDLFKTSRLRNFMFESTWFPRDRGFFLKGALGFGDYEYAEFEGGPTVHSSGGLAGSAGFGYAVRLLSSVNLILGADVVGARYFDGAQCVAVRPSLGVYWY